MRAGMLFEVLHEGSGSLQTVKRSYYVYKKESISG